MAQGLPVLDIGPTGNATIAGAQVFHQEETYRTGRILLPPDAAWSRTIRALGLKALPPAPDELDDLTVATLACMFLDRDGRAAAFGRDARFGMNKDECDAISPIYWRMKAGAAPTSEWSPATRLALQDGLAAFRKQGLPQVLQTGPRLPFRMLLRWPAGTERRFNAARGGYELTQDISSPGRLDTIFGTPFETGRPTFWPISEADAAAFEARRIKVRGEPLYMALQVTLVGAQRGSGDPALTRDTTGLPDGALWRVEEGDFSIYEDMDLTRRLYSFPRSGGGQPDQLATVPAPPAAARNGGDAVQPGGDAAANAAAAARAWDLPTHDGMPVFELSGGSPAKLATFYIPAADTAKSPYHGFPPAVGAWTRAIRALGLSLFPATAAAADDQELRRLACVFLPPDERTRLYGRNPAFGDRNDLCVRIADEDGANARVLFRNGAAAFRADALPSIVAKAPTLPLRILVDVVTTLGSYDRAAGGYPIQGVSAINAFRMFGTLLDVRFPEFWPVSEAEAAAFETRRGPEVVRRVHVAVPLTVTGVTPATPGAPFESATGLPSGARLIVEPDVAVLYDDAELSSTLHRFGKQAAAPAAADRTQPVGDADGAATANGIAAAAQWRLPMRLGLPVADANDYTGGGVKLDADRSNPRPGHFEWATMMYALSLSQSPDVVAQMRSPELIGLACIFLPPSRLAATGMRPFCNGGTPGLADEFRVRDLADAFRTTDLARIVQAAPRLPFKLLFIMPVMTKAWDDVRNGFPLGDPMGYGPPLFGTPLRFKPPALWPASEQVARRFVESRRANPYAPVYLAVQVTITGITDTPAGLPQRDPRYALLDSQTALPRERLWDFEFGAGTLYADVALTQKLYDFGRLPAVPKPVIGTPAAASPHPAGPVPFNAETPLLAVLAQSPPASLAINWEKAAAERMTLDGALRQQPEWAASDPWGVLFKPHARDDKPDAAEVAAYRDWTAARVKALPGSFVFRNVPAYPVAGVAARSLSVFEPYNDRSWSGSSAVPFRRSTVANLAKLPPEIVRYGLTPAQVIPLDMRFAGLDAPVLAVLPRERSAYVLDLPNGVPPQPALMSGTVTDGSVLDVEVAIDSLEAVGVDDGRELRKLVLMRVRPIGATLRTTGDGRVVAATSFPRTEWPAAAASPPVLWPPPVPGTAEQALGAPYGPELAGVRLGMGIAEAETIVRARMQVGRILDLADPVRQLPRDEQAFGPTLDGRMFVSDDVGESVVVFTSRVPPVGRVVGISRRTAWDVGDWEKALATLTGQYGPPQGNTGNGAFWGDRSMLAGRDRSQCNGSGVGQSGWDSWTENGRPVRLSLSPGSGPLDAPGPPLLRNGDVPRSDAGVDRLANCFPVMYARPVPGNPPVTEARLFDLRTLAWLRAQAGAAPPRPAIAPPAGRAGPETAVPPDPKLTKGPYGPDVVGIRLGMTFEEAEAVIRANMKVTQVAETAPASAAEAATPSGLFHGKMFVGDDRPDEYFRERIAIFDVPAQAAGRVVAVERLLYHDEGLWDRIAEQLTAKYGIATRRQPFPKVQVWLERGDDTCFLYQADSSRHQWRVLDAANVVRRRGPALREVPLPNSPQLQAAYPRCGTVVEASEGQGTESGADMKPLNSLRTRLYDTTVLSRLLREQTNNPPAAAALPMKF